VTLTLENCVGMPVRIRRRETHGKHMTPAILVSLDGDRAIVRPIGHGHDEVLERSQVRVWKSGVARWKECRGASD